MDLGDRLRHWWDRVRGYEPPTAKPVARTQPLKLSVEGSPTQTTSESKRKSRHGEAGFDPYSSTGGYHKPRTWDDIHRK